jgi:hypothetical protein
MGFFMRLNSLRDRGGETKKLMKLKSFILRSRDGQKVA